MTSNQNFADLANEYIFSVYVLVRLVASSIKTYCQETPHNNITSHQTVAQSGDTVLGRGEPITRYLLIRHSRSEVCYETNMYESQIIQIF